MIAEYVYRWPQTNREEVRHRCPVDSPMDIELQRQLTHLQKNGGSRYFRRVVDAPKRKEDE